MAHAEPSGWATSALSVPRGTVLAMVREVLFVQGGGAGVHDAWDAAPYVRPGGWPATGLELAGDLGARLPPGAAVHVVHGLADATVPPEHADLYARAIPQAQVHRLPGRDHQLGDDLSEVATAIRASTGGPVSSR